MLEAYPARWSPPHERYFRLELRAPKGPKTFFVAVSLPCLPGRSGQRENKVSKNKVVTARSGLYFPAPTRYHPTHPGSPPSEKLGGQWKGGGCAVKYGWEWPGPTIPGHATCVAAAESSGR